jgi:hypothetical protein
MSYEPLPIEITQNGSHHYRQLWRDDHAAVYQQRNAFGAFLGYEAIAELSPRECRMPEARLRCNIPEEFT